MIRKTYETCVCTHQGLGFCLFGGGGGGGCLGGGLGGGGGCLGGGGGVYTVCGRKAIGPGYRGKGDGTSALCDDK